MAFKIAMDAGHYLKTPGKRCLKKLDPNETREWVLNDRVARYFAEAAQQYEGVELLRVDDPTGKKDVSLANRCKAANKWGADMYHSFHHNAGINGGSGGGLVVYSNKGSTKGAKYRDTIYAACIDAGGIKGNRAEPVQAYGFYVLKHTDAPAVLTEYGFMDSKVDVPVILRDSFAKQMGYATMEAIAEVAGLRKKQSKPAEPVETDALDLPVLKRGDKNDTVKAMQILLIGRGFECGDSGADGSFGPATEKALSAFQKSKICDITTWKKLLGV
ncbi:N-acetylmuramoyl-L-alanine amidase [Succinimonas sp.]|uniref:N-acetylmuramoyl-L-alanine amidase n=1 Tax=Succinimonas sp. TaxID=1936151 RepID=UPI003869ACB6